MSDGPFQATWNTDTPNSKINQGLASAGNAVVGGIARGLGALGGFLGGSGGKKKPDVIPLKDYEDAVKTVRGANPKDRATALEMLIARLQENGFVVNPEKLEVEGVLGGKFTPTGADILARNPSTPKTQEEKKVSTPSRPEDLYLSKGNDFLKRSKRTTGQMLYPNSPKPPSAPENEWKGGYGEKNTGGKK
jgi:ABC-type transport system substrate-binding protein